MERRFRRGIVSPPTLIATAFIGFATIFGFILIPAATEPVAEMYLAPASKTVPLGEMFTVDVMVRSTEPTNVFAGELLFDTDTLGVSSISYNTSIADLWAERPWYSSGAGTVNFAGGTTRPGGFVGNDSLLRITFETVGSGESELVIQDPHILRHDGEGTEVTLPTPIDSVFTIEDDGGGTSSFENIVSEESARSPVKIIEEPPTTDLNGDGEQSIADISIFMLNIAGNDPRFDFNGDGKVNTKDLSILLDAE